MIRRPPRSTHCISSAASDVYKRQDENCAELEGNPDDAAGRLEWEAKTMARKQVREKADCLLYTSPSPRD